MTVMTRLASLDWSVALMNAASQVGSMLMHSCMMNATVQLRTGLVIPTRHILVETTGRNLNAGASSHRD